MDKYNDAGMLITPQSTKDYLSAEALLANASIPKKRNSLEQMALILRNLTNNYGRGMFYEEPYGVTQRRELLRNIYNGY